MNELQSYLEKALKQVNLETTDKEPVVEDYDIYEELRQIITATRSSLNMTQTQLSKKSGISQSNISRIEGGNYRPSIAMLKKIADSMGKRLVIDFAEQGEFE